MQIDDFIIENVIKDNEESEDTSEDEDEYEDEDDISVTFDRITNNRREPAKRSIHKH